MFERSRVGVVVPAFNVESRLRAVLCGVPAFVDDIVVIDDGSIDGTSGIGRSTDDQRITVVRHETNRGVGAAIATGYCRALELGMDVVVVMAGDGQMDPRDLAGLVAPVATGAADYAKGNRLRHPAVLRVMPWARLIGNIVLSALTRAATGLRHIGDSQCGYTAIHRRVLAVLDPRAMWARYGYPNHLLGALARHSFRVVDVPVRPVYAGELSGLRLRDALVTIPRILVRIAIARASRFGNRTHEAGGFVQISTPAGAPPRASLAGQRS